MAVVRIDLEVNEKGEAKIRQATGDLNQLAQASTKAKGAIGSIFQGVGQGVGQRIFDVLLEGAKAVPTFLAGAARAVIAYGGALIDARAKTALAVEAQQKLTFAGKLVGVTFEQISAATTKMQKNLFDAPEGFKRIGLSAERLRQLKPEDQFVAIAQRLQQIQDPAARASVAMEIFGKSGAELLPLLTSNMQAAMEQAERLGLVMSTEVAGAADDLGDSIDTLQSAWEGLKNRIGAVIVTSAPLHALVGGLTEIMTGLSGSVKDNEAGMRSFVDNGVLFVAKGLTTLVQSVGIAMEAFSGLKVFMNNFLIVTTSISEALATASMAMPWTTDEAKAEYAVQLANIAESQKKWKQGWIDELNQMDTRKKEVGKLVDQLKALEDRIGSLRGQKHSGAPGSAGASGLSIAGSAAEQALKERLDREEKITKAVEAGYKDYWDKAGEAFMRGAAPAGMVPDTLLTPMPAFKGEMGPMGIRSKDLSRDLVGAVGRGQIAGSLPAGGTSVGQRLSQGLLSGLKDLPGVIQRALEGGGDVGRSIGGIFGGSVGGSIATGIKKVFGSKAIGSALGAALPGVGTLLGSLAGGVVDKVFGRGGIFGGGEGARVNDMRDEVFKAAGGFDQLNKRAHAAGLTLKDVLAAKTVKDFEKAIGMVNTRLSFIESFGGIDQLRLQAEEAQVPLQALFDATDAEQLEAAIKDIKDELQLWTDANKALDDAMQRWGITVDQLSGKARQLRLDADFKQLYTDWRVLTEGGGVDPSVVWEKMGASINAYVNSTIQAGATVPEAMRPILQWAIDNKLLLDENGNAFESLEASGVTFAQTLEASIAKLIEKIDLFVSKLLGIPTNVNTNVTTTFDGGQPPGSPYPIPAASGFGPMVAPNMGGGLGPLIQTHAGEGILVVPKKKMNGKVPFFFHAAGGFGKGEQRERTGGNGGGGATGGSDVFGSSDGSSTGGSVSGGTSSTVSNLAVVVEQLAASQARTERAIATLAERPAVVVEGDRNTNVFDTRGLPRGSQEQFFEEWADREAQKIRGRRSAILRAFQDIGYVPKQ